MSSWDDMIALMQQSVKRKILPRPAGNPALDRAISIVDRSNEFDPELRAANIKEMPWSDPYATSNILGATDINNNIEMNPSTLALYPQNPINRTLVHELTHVRQNRKTDNPENVWAELAQRYEDRPREKEAFKVADDYYNRKVSKQQQYEDGLFGFFNQDLFRGIPPLIRKK